MAKKTVMLFVLKIDSKLGVRWRQRNLQKKCAVSSEFLFCWLNLLLTVIISVDSQARKWSWARFPPLSRSEAGNRACQPSTSTPRSFRFPSEKTLGTRLVSLTRFRSKTDDLMENSRGKRCALDIQDYSQVDKLDVHLSYFLDIKSLTDFLKRENTKRIIYFVLLTQARFPFKKIKAWVFYLIPQKQRGGGRGGLTS